MRHFTVRQFAKACQAQYFGPEEVLEQEIHGVVIDNRQIEEGYLFAAVAGERVDGHTFIPSAFEKGAICALSEQKLENPSGPYLLVENTLQALKDAAEAYRKTLTHRKCRKDQYQRDDFFNLEPEIFSSEDSWKSE